jgi:hypothetical protein
MEEGALFKDLVKGAYGLTFIVRIGRIWDHYTMDRSKYYGINLVMVDRKASELYVHCHEVCFLQNILSFYIQCHFKLFYQINSAGRSNRRSDPSRDCTSVSEKNQRGISLQNSELSHRKAEVYLQSGRSSTQTLFHKNNHCYSNCSSASRFSLACS